MPIFDRYIAVDWSANNGPKTGKDSIWIGEATPAGPLPSRKPTTRSSAMALLTTFLSAPSDLAPADRAIAVAEEGWIAGVGHEALRMLLREAA